MTTLIPNIDHGRFLTRRSIIGAAASLLFALSSCEPLFMDLSMRGTSTDYFFPRLRAVCTLPCGQAELSSSKVFIESQFQ